MGAFGPFNRNRGVGHELGMVATFIKNKSLKAILKTMPTGANHVTWNCDSAHGPWNVWFNTFTRERGIVDPIRA